jgi:hypothetical protein
MWPFPVSGVPACTSPTLPSGAQATCSSSGSLEPWSFFLWAPTLTWFLPLGFSQVGFLIEIQPRVSPPLCRAPEDKDTPILGWAIPCEHRRKTGCLVAWPSPALVAPHQLSCLAVVQVLCSCQHCDLHKRVSGPLIS